jgi:predicted dehydrogenase
MTRQTRREFLENSMLAAAAAAMTGTKLVSPASAEEQATGPNERLRVAVLGLNGRGQSHLGGFVNRNGCDVVAVCDPDEAVGQNRGVAVVESKTGVRPAYYQDLRKLLENKEIDIVSIATPNHWHSLAAIWAIQAGKDVYVEKPVSHNVSEGRRVVDAARKHGKICQAGTQCRSALGTNQLMDFLHKGGIGEIKLARGLCYKSRESIGPRGTYEVPSGVDYNVWCGPAPMNPLTRPKFHYDWHWQWDYGNGDLGNQGIHQMDLARWGLGQTDLGRSVISYGGRLGYEDAGETANTQVSIHDYGDKALVFEVRGLPTADLRGAKVGVIFEGTEGYAVMASYSGGSVFDLSGNKLHTFEGGGDERIHFDNFLSAVRSRKVEELNADILDGHLSSALCHLGNISYRLGQPVSVDEAHARLGTAAQKDECLETFERVKNHLAENHVDLESAKMQFGAMLTLDGKAETFTGAMSGKANPYLTREYRKGFEVPASAQLV